MAAVPASSSENNGGAFLSDNNQTDFSSSLGGANSSDYNEEEEDLYRSLTSDETSGVLLPPNPNSVVDPFYYGPSIGSKMNVPDSIALVRDDEMQNFRLSDKMFSANQAAAMSIPDRISLDGASGGARDRDLFGSSNSAVSAVSQPALFNDPEVLTPPRHLRMEEFAFPSVADRPKTAGTSRTPGAGGETPSNKSKKVKLAFGATEAIYNDSVFQESTEDVLAVRKQVLALSRKIAAIEQENKASSVRENYLMYSIAALFGFSLILFMRK